MLSAIPWLIPVVVVRTWVHLSGRCILDSDEGVKGIVMIEALRGEFRAFFHGQDYLGSLPWIAGSPTLLIFGPNPNGLRVIYIAFMIAALLLWRGILRRMGAAGAWPWFVLLIGIAPAFMVEFTMRARGIMEGLLTGSIWLWVVMHLLNDSRPFREINRWLFALGIATGVAWWSTQLTLFIMLPGTILLLLNARVRKEIHQLIKSPAFIIWCAAVAFTTIVFFRATLHYQSSMQEILWHARGPLLVAWILALAAAGSFAHFGRLPRWSVFLLLGLVLGYLPPLLTVWSKEIIYNTTALQPPYALWGNIRTFLMMGSLDLLGIGSDRTEWPWYVAAAATFSAGLWLCGFLMACLEVTREWRQGNRPPTIDIFVVIATIWGFVFFCVAGQPTIPISHYGIFPGFALFLGVTILLWRIHAIDRWASIGVTALLLIVNVASIVNMSRTPIVLGTGVEQVDSDVIEFVLAMDIHIAATSMAASSTGYWESYRLTFSSGERLRVHPILHSPRIDRYREELQEATETVFIVTDPTLVTMTLQRAGLTWQEKSFGRLTVIYGFDKTEVDRLGLIDYRRWLDE